MKSQIICAVPIGITLAILTSGAVSAEERCKMSWETPAAASKYTQQLALDVGDMPDHQVRVYEVQIVYPPDTKPNCEGLKLVGRWYRAYSDYVDRNGRTWGYSVTTLEGGDKIFGTFSGTSQTVVALDGSKKNTNEHIATWTGGTGKYLGVRGIERAHVIFDPVKNVSQQQTEAEYWFEK